MSGLPRNEILVGDARSRLTKLPAASVDCIITSPPFFRLRDYQTEGQLGLEDSVAEWVEGLRSVLLEVMRVLKPTGSVWLNLGDSYSRHDRFGAPSKSLLLGPERLALALISDGWTIRNKLVWAKTNNMPSSVGDRLTCKWEPLLLRSGRHSAPTTQHHSCSSRYSRTNRRAEARLGRTVGREQQRAGSHEAPGSHGSPTGWQSWRRHYHCRSQLPWPALRHLPRASD
jgi:hypothetical protein